MKRELIWWSSFIVVALLIVGQMTGFHFESLIFNCMIPTTFCLPTWELF